MYNACGCPPFCILAAEFLVAAVHSHFADCPDSHTHFCFHGTCRFLILEETPACVWVYKCTTLLWLYRCVSWMPWILKCKHSGSYVHNVHCELGLCGDKCAYNRQSVLNKNNYNWKSQQNILGFCKEEVIHDTSPDDTWEPHSKLQ